MLLKKILLAIFLLTSLMFYSPSVSAVSISGCQLEPRALNTSDKAHLKVNATSGGLTEGFTLRIRRTTAPLETVNQTPFSLSPGGSFETDIGPFTAGSYESLVLRDSDPNSLSCVVTLQVTDSSSPNANPLYRRIEPASLTSSTPINLIFETNAGVNLISYIVSVDGRTDAPAHLTRTSDTEAQATLGPLPNGNYLARLQRETLSGPQLIGTPIPFTVGPTAGGPGGGGINCSDPKKCSKSAGVSCDPNGPTDSSGNLKPNGTGGVWTAIGCIPTEPKILITKLMGFSAGIGGGIALLLMIFGAFQMMTAAGNPEAIKKGKDQFLAAAIGLLFVILSATLLRILGVNILNIPGFS